MISINSSKCNINSSKLNYDECCLLFTSSNHDVTIKTQSVECKTCDLQTWSTIDKDTSVSLLLKTRYNMIIEFDINNSNGSRSICNFDNFQTGDRGVYKFSINNTSCGDLITLKEPDSQLLPLLLVLVTCFILGLGLYLFNRFRHIFRSDMENDLLRSSPLVRKHRTRIRSLDAFRGLSIALMIFVNYGGGKYNIFEHSIWNGITIADIVFPSFMWIMGVSLVISLRSQLRSGCTRLELCKRVIIRSVKLFLFGLILNSRNSNNFETLRIFGVLQRLSIGYAIVALLEAWKLGAQTLEPSYYAICDDFRDTKIQWFFTMLLLLIHVFTTLYFPVPNCPFYFGPGGLDMHSSYENCTGGSAGYIDRLILGENHMYGKATCKKIYHNSVNFDPEGILGLFTTVLLIQMGAQCARIILVYNTSGSRIKRWLMWSFLTGFVGLSLCGFNPDGGIFPINKNMNSFSFILVNASIDFLIFSILYIIIDMKHIWNGAPFTFAGMNALALYIGHSLTNNLLPWKWEAITSTHAEYLAMDFWATLLWLCISYYLFHSNIFITV